MQVDPVPEIRDILRALVGNSRDIILVDQHDGGVMAIGWSEFLNVDHRSVCNTSSGFEPGAAVALDFIRGLRLAAQQGVSAEQRDAATCNQSI